MIEIGDGSRRRPGPIYDVNLAATLKNDWDLGDGCSTSRFYAVSPQFAISVAPQAFTAVFPQLNAVASNLGTACLAAVHLLVARALRDRFVATLPRMAPPDHSLSRQHGKPLLSGRPSPSRERSLVHLGSCSCRHAGDRHLQARRSPRPSSHARRGWPPSRIRSPDADREGSG